MSDSSAGLQVYNTLTRKKEKFEPLSPPEVRIYLCGPTVYDFLHVGNFRGPIFYNFLRNWLEESGYKVRMIQNYTDVDDKIIVRANELKEAASQVSHKYIEEYKKDFEALSLRKHDQNPKVSESMDSIRELIEVLMKKDMAYKVPSGDVYFRVNKFSEYGKLSNNHPDNLHNGEGGREKDHPLDFALWKSSKPGEPEDVRWQAPWGEGRPGWHIECSAMARKSFGDQIDIHGGGTDLVFPHHENEIAQTEAATGKPFAKYWVHWNMINFGGAKMSKSLGNIKTGRSFIEEYHPEILKYMMLSAHYRSTLDLSEESIHQGISGLARIYSALAMAQEILSVEGPIEGKSPLNEVADKAWKDCVLAFNDDFNTAEAFARLFEVVRAFNGLAKKGQKSTPLLRAHAKALQDLVAKLGKLMAVFNQPAKEFLISLDQQLLKRLKLDKSQIELMIEERKTARAAKDFKKSDEIRDQLAAMGISVADTPQGMEWEVTK